MKKPYYLISILKTKFFQTVVVLTLSLGGAYAQTGQKYSTGGNALSAGDVLGSTNNQAVTIIANGAEVVSFKPSGTAVFKKDIKLKGGLQVTDFSGSGFRLLQVDANGNIVLLNGTGSADDILLGNGTFGNFNNMADGRISNFFDGNGNQLVLDNGNFIDITTFINTYAPSLNSYFTGSVNQVVNGQGTFTDFSDMLEVGLHDFGLYYSHGNLGVGTTTPSSTLDVAGDLTVHGRIFLVEGKTKSEQVETEQIYTKTVEAEERISAPIFASQELRSEVIQMDSQTKIVGETNVEGEMNVSETMTIGRGISPIGEGGQEQPPPTPVPTFRLNVLGGTKITGSAYVSENLGLGVEAPTEKLDIVGNAKLSGDITLGGDLRLNNTDVETNTTNPIFLTLGAGNKVQQFDPIQNPIFTGGWQTGNFSDGSKYSNFLNGRAGINTPAEREDCYPELEEMLQVKGAGHFKPKGDYNPNNSEEVGERCTIIGHDGLHGVIDVSAVHTITIPTGGGGDGTDVTGETQVNGRVVQHTDPGHLKLGLYSGADVEINSDNDNQWAYAGGSNLFVKGHVGINAPYDQGNYRLNVGGIVNSTGYYLNGTPLITTQWTTTSTGNINYNGNVGISNTAPQAKLDILIPASTNVSKVIRISDGTTENFRVDNNGNVYAREVNVVVAGDVFPDYVFLDGYQLMTPKQLGEFFKKYKHLPNMPTAAEIAKSGMSLSKLSLLHTEKIEELSVYAVEQDKQLEEQKKQLEEQDRKLAEQGKQLEKQDQQLKEQQKQINELVKKLNK